MKPIQYPTPKPHASTPTHPSSAMLLLWILIASSANAGEWGVTPRPLSGRARTGYFQRQAESLRQLINDSRGQVEEMQRSLRMKEGRLIELNGTIARLNREISQTEEQSRTASRRVDELERRQISIQSATKGESQRLTKIADESKKSTGGIFHAIIDALFGRKKELSKESVQKVAPVARTLTRLADQHDDFDRVQKELDEKRATVARLKREREKAQENKNTAEVERASLARVAASERTTLDPFVQAFQALPTEIRKLEEKQASVLKRYETSLSTRDLGPRFDPRNDRLVRLRNEMALKGFNVQKDAISQDAFASNLSNLRFAIADGATRNSDFSETLAQSLVRRWVERAQSFMDFQQEVQNDWTQATFDSIAERSKLERNRDKVWNSYATFVGAELTRGNLRVTAVGDACVFILRNGKVRPFPISTLEGFSNPEGRAKRPDFFVAKGEAEKVMTRDFQVEVGDEVFMATDALAQWIFAEVKERRDPFSVLRRMRNRNDLRDFMRLAHDGKFEKRSELTEDDTTLLQFKIPRL